MLAAQVIAVDLWGNSEYSSLKLNKGSNEGLKKGMGVVTHDGVVGYLLNVSPHYSTVLVLTDRNAVIDSLVQRTRARGIVEGLGRDICHIKYLQRTDDVQIGDLVVTGFDGIFPKGFPIGAVTKVQKKAYGVTQYVEMRPIVDVARLEEVFVVLAPDVVLDRLKQAQASNGEKTP
jgi:rod shape-determining protein MreC